MSSGKANLLAQQIWAEEINSKGGLLGRPVQLVFYDDQTNASVVPGIYAKLIDIDGVRVSTDDGWWLLRASNTQPVLVARCEAPDETRLQRLMADLKAALAASGVSLPDDASAGHH